MIWRVAGSNLTIAGFEAGLERCKLKPEAAHAIIESMLEPKSKLWTALDPVIDSAQARVREMPLTIAIDDFTSFAGPKPAFTSYFVHGAQGPIIGLDCSSRARREYWHASLAHELVHALFDGQDTQSWWEEGIAQLVEREAGGVQPELDLRYLEDARTLPGLLVTRRPLPDRLSYAMSYLFASYVRASFGGWEILKAMNRPVDDCAGSAAFISRLSCRGWRALTDPFIAQRFADSVLRPDKMTPAGLLRYFYVALTLDDPIEPKYRIPGWNGFKAMPYGSLEQRLKPGQATVLRSEQALEALDQVDRDLEVYRVLADAHGGFQILLRDQLSDVPAGFVPVKDYVLVINLTPVGRAVAR
jgi:hypothetical protein